MYLVVLVGGDCDKLGLGENKGVLPSSPPQHVPGFYNVNSGLVAMQWVQDYLEIKENRLKICHLVFRTETFMLTLSSCRTYMSLSVKRVVGQLGVVKRDGAALPVSPCGRWVRVDEDPVRQPGLCSANGLPATTLEAIAWVVCRDYVQEEDVAERWVQARDL